MKNDDTLRLPVKTMDAPGWAVVTNAGLPDEKIVPEFTTQAGAFDYQGRHPETDLDVKPLKDCMKTALSGVRHG